MDRKMVCRFFLILEFIGLFIFLALVLQPTDFEKEVYAEEREITVIINGKTIPFPDKKPQIQDGRTLVPIRGVFEELGYQVDWDKRVQLVTLTSDGMIISVQAGADFLEADGESVPLAVSAQIIEDRMMLPLRAILEVTHAEIVWDESTKTITVTT